MSQQRTARQSIGKHRSSAVRGSLLVCTLAGNANISRFTAAWWSANRWQTQALQSSQRPAVNISQFPAVCSLANQRHTRTFCSSRQYTARRFIEGRGHFAVHGTPLASNLAGNLNISRIAADCWLAIQRQPPTFRNSWQSAGQRPRGKREHFAARGGVLASDLPETRTFHSSRKHTA